MSKLTGAGPVMATVSHTMPDAIPSDLLARFREEVKNRWPEFITGAPLFFGGLNIRKDKRGKVVVACYSDCYYQENLTENEARERIQVAKQEVARLADAFPQLEAEINQAGVDFEFCYDYGTAAVVVAEERSGVFKSVIRSG